KALVDKVEQVARLIRSKGVGVYFITQNPADVPEDILGQLGNRVQHALRAFTAKDQKALRQAAENYRPNPAFDIADAITEVGTGEAVTSMLENKGIPGIAQRTLIRPPSSKLGPIESSDRKALMATSPMGAKYDNAVDRESAHEILLKRADAAAKEAAAAEEAEAKAEEEEREFRNARRYDGGSSRSTKTRTTRTRSTKDETFGEAIGSAVIKELKGTTGRRIVRGILGTLFKSR
ncbi:MAG: DUF853 family protein, partial [Marivivens sp.]|nr:DUF853 family protein [Marivivens sp.]